MVKAVRSDTEISLFNELGKLGRTFFDKPLAYFTTFRTGGPADILFEPGSEDDICKALPLIAEAGIPYTFIGGGSNLLVSDEGIRGVVVRICREDLQPVFSGSMVYSSAVVNKESLIRFAVDNFLGGVEFMAGIPGTVGGGIFMNAGTYMGSFADILKSVKIAHMDGRVEEIETDSSLHKYRSMGLPPDCVILGGLFNLPVSDNISAVNNCIAEIITERKAKHPMDYPSAGSVFKNPEGHSSWKLINDAGLKGSSIGGAMVSEKHTNFIINTGNALSTDIYRLIRHVQETVYTSSGIILETEVRLLGKFD